MKPEKSHKAGAMLADDMKSKNRADSMFPRNSNLYSSLPSRLALARGAKVAPLDVKCSTRAGTADRHLKLKDGDETMTSFELYDVLNEAPSDDCFGMSGNLSTESIRKACGYFDDELRENDLIELQSSPEYGEEPHKSLETATGYKRRDSDGGQQCDDAMIVLNELDAILDTHTTSEAMLGHESDTKVEDCLLDLDNYLEEMDDCSITNSDSQDAGQHSDGSPARQQRQPFRRNRTLSLKRKTFSTEPYVATTLDSKLERGHGLRKTISGHVASHQSSSTETSLEPTSDDARRVWSRNSIHSCSPTSPDIDHSLSHAHSLSTSNNSMVDYGSTDVTSFNDELGLKSSNLEPHTEAAEFTQHQGLSAALAAPANPTETLTLDNIFSNILAEQDNSSHNMEDRPRQFGRRGEGHPRIMSLRSAAPTTSADRNSCTIISHDQRPMSAPTTSTRAPVDVPRRTERHSSLYLGSEASSIRSSRNASPVSIVSSSDSNSTTISTNVNMDTNLVPAGGQQTRSSSANAEAAHARVPPHRGCNGEWPCSWSRTLALLCCTLGLFNLCRFAVLTVHYGGNFLLQFLLLSILFGIPLLWLQMSLGDKIRAGPVTMWRISPICRGIGIALLLVQCLMAIYSSVAISWILIYLRDCFNTSLQPPAVFRWQEPIHPHRHAAVNESHNLTETAADYFNVIVLQRMHFVKRSADGSGAGDIKFRVSDRLAFNLALLWSVVFLILCRGLRSYGKVVVVLTLLPLITLVVVTVKLLCIVDPTKLQNIFAAADFDEFLINSKTWTAAAQEVFLSWGLMGCSVIAVTSRSHASRASDKTTLRRDAILVVLATMLGLTVSAVLGLACVEILKEHNYAYVPGSFEHSNSYTAVYSLRDPLNGNILSFPPKWVPHYSSFVGETYRRSTGVSRRESGYQSLRFVSELLPAAMALASGSFSWIWAVVTFAMLILLGLAQLCVMWKPISSAMGNTTSSVLLTCVTGLLLSIPFATDAGILILHYMDVVVGGAWFIPLLWTALIFGVFLIRGRPYNGDDLVNDLRMSGSMSAFLALSWNVLLPIGLVTLAVIDYKTSLSNQFYHWRGKSYFSYWARKVAALTQIGFLLLVPITAIIQIYRYLTKGPPDILDRIQLLYRPPEGGFPESRGAAALRRNREGGGTHGQAENGNSDANADLHRGDSDAPPKYTPPPSYTTATGARLAKLLRQSIRRSVRRILGDTARTRPNLPSTGESSQTNNNLPPDYLTVYSNPAGYSGAAITQASQAAPEMGDRGATTTAYTQRSFSLGRKAHSTKQQRWQKSLQRPASDTRALGRNSDGTSQRPYTAEDVVTILRSSTSDRRAARAVSRSSRELHEIQPQIQSSFRSIENLILNAEPLGQSAAVLERQNADSEAAPSGNVQKHTSVI